MNPQYLTDRQVAKRYAISRPTVWRWTRLKRMPAPESIGPNTRRWRLADLEKWDAERAGPDHASAA